MAERGDLIETPGPCGFEGAGFRVSTAADATALRLCLTAGPIDLVLLDVELPGEDGFEVATMLRATSNLALIFVTRRVDVVDRVAGLELGADDYITKPPDMRELVARVRAVLRRRARPPTADPVTSFGPWRLDRARCCLTGPGAQETPLTQGELAVLLVLLDAQGRVVARERLVEALAITTQTSNARSVDVLVHRLRRKLGEGGAVEPRILLTVHGVGYRVGVDVATSC